MDACNARLWHFFIFLGGFMARYDGSIRINTRINTDGVRQGESDIRGSMNRISGSAKKLYATLAAVFAVGKIAQFGKEALQAASDFEAMEAQFSQVFGNLEEDASQSLSAIANQAGIAEERMKNSFTKIAAFAKTTGMDTASSLKLSERAMIAVADSAAFYDRSLEETTEYLQSFLKGNYENDAALGLSATEYTRNAAAMKLYGKSFIELSEAQKQLTLLQMVEDANRLSGAMGQAAREADTWTNQVGNLKQAWTTLMASIGKIILPVAIQAVKFITNVINSLNAMIARLSVAARAFRSFSELLTGNKSSAGSGAGNIASSGGISESTADGYNAAADAAENLAGSTKKAAKATKDAKKAAEGYLNPLDEINKINEKDSTSGSGGGGGGAAPGIGGAVENVDYGSLAEGENAVDKLSDSLKALIDKFKELAGLFKQGFFEGLGDYKPRIEEIKKDIMSIGRTLKEIFTDPEVVTAVNRFADQLAYSLGQVTGSIASIGLTIAQNLVGGMEKYLTQNTERIKQYIISMFDIGTEIAAIIGDFSIAFADIFSVFGGDTAQQITGNLIGIFAEVKMLISENAAKLGRDILHMITLPMIENKDKIKAAIEGALQAIEPFTSGLLTAVQAVRDAVADIYDNHLKPLFDSIASGLSKILGKLLDGYTEYIVPVLQGLGKRFKELMEGPFGETIDKVATFIGKLIDAVKLLWEKVLVPFFSWIASNIMPVLAPIIETIGTKFLSAIESIIKAIGVIADVLGGLIDFITGVFTGNWKLAFDGMKTIVQGFADGVKLIISGVASAGGDIIQGLLDGVADTMSGIARWIKDTIVDPFIDAFKSLFGIHSPSTVMAEMGKYLMEGLLGGIEGLAGNVKDAWDSMKQTAVQTWETVKQNVGSKWEQIKTNSKTTFGTISSNIKTSWDNIKTNVKSAADTAKNNIVTAWKTAGDNTRTSWENMRTNAISAAKTIASKVDARYLEIKSAVRSFASSAPSSWKRAWDSMGDKVSTVLSSIKRTVNNVFGWISDSIRNLGNSLKNLSSNASSAGRSGTSYTRFASARAAAPTPYTLYPAMAAVDTSKIPGYATGQVIPARMRQHLAILGDNNRETEVVSPLSTIKQANKESLLEVLSELGLTGGRGVGNPQTIVIKQYLDGKQVTQAVIKEGKLQQMSTGNNIFMLGTT